MAGNYTISSQENSQGLKDTCIQMKELARCTAPRMQTDSHQGTWTWNLKIVVQKEKSSREKTQVMCKGPRLRIAPGFWTPVLQVTRQQDKNPNFHGKIISIDKLPIKFGGRIYRHAKFQKENRRSRKEEGNLDSPFQVNGFPGGMREGRPGWLSGQQTEGAASPDWTRTGGLTKCISKKKVKLRDGLMGSNRLRRNVQVQQRVWGWMEDKGNQNMTLKSRHHRT